MEALPNELYKEIFTYFSDYTRLRLVNKLFLKITNNIQINNGVIIPISSNMISKFMETESNKMSWVIIDNSHNLCGVVIHCKLDFTVTTENLDYYLYDIIRIWRNVPGGEYLFRKSSKDICDRIKIKNTSYNFYPNKYSNKVLFPLKEVILYYINNHYLNNYLNNYLDQKFNFTQRSLLKTLNWYIEGMKKIYPSNSEYIDYYLDLWNLNEDNNLNIIYR